MARTVAIGVQDFGKLREGGAFYVDKTGFISDWWRSQDDITLVCRPRRFGKTLALSTAEHFLSTRFAGRGEELFGGLAVWGDPAMRELQGTVPVVMVSFARAKGPTLEDTLASMKLELRCAVDAHGYLRESPALTAGDRAFLDRVADDMDDTTAASCLGQLCSMLRRHHGVRPVVLLDEYDAPMQEAWTDGYWDEISAFVRGLFNATFKTNPALGRALVTGITRVASESIFSDMNNPAVVTTTTPQYERAFGFTQAEVDAALSEFGYEEDREAVREWYDGFTFGSVTDIYNPWSITNYLKHRRIEAHWVNTSSNGLVSSLVRRGDEGLKSDFEELLADGAVTKRVDEKVSFKRLRTDPEAVWPLLLATGYLKVAGPASPPGTPPGGPEPGAQGKPEAGAQGKPQGEPGPAPESEPQPEPFAPAAKPASGTPVLRLELTNLEVREGFDGMVREWFGEGGSSYNRFVRALLAGDAEAMTDYLCDLAEACMSSFDSGVRPSRNQPERFWRGLVLGLLVELRGRYAVESNRESGYGRYDVMLVPSDGADAVGGTDPAIVIEFKVLNARRGERTLEDAVTSARAQIESESYAASLAERGIGRARIREYGIAFSGKEALVTRGKGGGHGG